MRRGWKILIGVVIVAIGLLLALNAVIIGKRNQSRPR